MPLLQGANTQQEVLNRAWVNSINQLQKKRWTNINALKGILGNIGKDIKKEIDKVVELAKFGKVDEVTSLQRLALLTNEIRNLSKGLGYDINANLERDLVDIYRNSYYRSAWQLDIATPELTNINFAMLSVDQIRAAIVSQFKGGMFSERLFRISDEIAGEIQADITRGILLGRGIDETAEEVYVKFGDEGSGYFWRAQRIARTETIRARELGRIQLYKENADLIEEEEWINMESACEECQDLAERCNEGGETGLEPIIDSHPNCVCTKRAKLKPWDELAGGSDQPEGPKYNPFDEWAAEKGIEGVTE